MKEKIKNIINNISKIVKSIFNMFILAFTLIFFIVYSIYNPMVIIVTIFSFTIAIIISNFSKAEFNFWLFLRAFCLVKILFLFIYIESGFTLCINDINKAIIDTTVHIGSNFNLPQKTSLNFLESIGAVTLFFGSIYVAHRVLNSYVYKPDSVSGNSTNPIFSEGSVTYVDRAVSPLGSEVFESARSGSISSGISETNLSVGRCSSLEFSRLSGSIVPVDRSSSPGLSQFSSFKLEGSVSSLSSSSNYSPYPDTLSAPGLDTIKSQSSIISNCNSLSSSSLNTVISPEVIHIDFDKFYNNLPVVNFSLGNYNGNILPPTFPKVGSSIFLENPNLNNLINNLIPDDFREFALMQNMATQSYLENIYKLGFCIQAILQHIDDKEKGYLFSESLLVDLITTYKLMHECYEYNNIHMVYSSSDIIHKVLNKSKEFLINEKHSLVEFEKIECLFRSFYAYSSNNMPLSPMQYYKYEEALNFVNGVIRKESQYSELLKKVTEKDLTILDFTFKNLEFSGISTSNCLSIFKIAALCLFNINLGPINDIDSIVDTFLKKAITVVSQDSLQLPNDFEELHEQSVEKTNYYKNNIPLNNENPPVILIGELNDEEEENYDDNDNDNDDNDNDNDDDDNYDDGDLK